MDYMNQTAKDLPAGDTFLKKAASKTGEYEPSDIPGFVHPVTNGEVNKSAYIPEEAIGGEESPPVMAREEAIKIAKRKDNPEQVIYPEAV